jgi:hypothetical protein
MRVSLSINQQVHDVDARPGLSLLATNRQVYRTHSSTSG